MRRRCKQSGGLTKGKKAKHNKDKTHLPTQQEIRLTEEKELKKRKTKPRKQRQHDLPNPNQNIKNDIKLHHAGSGRNASLKVVKADATDAKALFLTS